MSTLFVRLTGLIALALACSIVPLPDWVSAFRPDWILLLVLYVQFFLPDSFRLFFVLVSGFLLDILLVTPIGEHSFALLLTTLLMVGKARRVHFFSIAQQMSVIALLCLFYQVILLVIDESFGFHTMVSLFSTVVLLAGTTLSCLLCWPWIKFVGDAVLLPKARQS
jgi:rod shape-determining protein MreD